ncbi:hypothetical protein CLG96_05335 [Sphingomonas oleivorans]|uniref:Reverse transcriptase domain-containing protein n=1 Tax=Sphingomonas oleivorans TaxID=1735121 RepID=A0A2T5FZA3_9SPHN|nr:reverse transcriptase domain-containing protein [Sphingomonas oleivorans]PTQ12005.1 hypothetical protein CLG96_05335 [Sphingomonas oleivorans]
MLDAIANGARFVVCADIQAFFTRISKEHVSSIIAAAVDDPPFMELFRTAIRVELANLADLRDKADLFPIEDIGVAQGNSLSPLLGNIALAEFDRIMNEGDCRCIRYIDDFIILAPTLQAANARLAKAKALLGKLGMQLSPEKSGKGGTSITKGFDFLGINICPGLVRPSAKSEARFLASLDKLLSEGKRSLRIVENGGTVERTSSFLGTLKRLDGAIDGWGKHYWFCCDQLKFQNLDKEIAKKLAKFIGHYGSIRDHLAPERRTQLLGVAELARQKREPFKGPRIKAKAAPPQ